jgi:transposase
MIIFLTLLLLSVLFLADKTYSSKGIILNFDKAQRQKEILALFENIEKSSLTVKDYFTFHQTPISLPQYYRVKKRYAHQGVAGIEDRRKSGNSRKLDSQKVELLRGVLTYNRHLTSASVKYELKEKWGINLDKSRIDQFRRQFGLTRIKEKIFEKEIVQFAGIEVFSALAHHVCILDCWKKTIQQRLDQVKHTEMFKDQSRSDAGDHVYARRRNGTFSPRYNRLGKIRKMKFASIADKVKDKDFSRLSLYQTTEDILNRKNLALLLLPLATNNGASRSLNKPLGNALGYACGYNYKNATIDKYLRELKYLQVSTDLIECNAKFWNKFWKQYDSTDYKIACYYIDGNVKPLWSSKRCRKGKVTMLGRVMNCLEQVVIHDSYGHPIYFRTFSGNADLQNYALKSMEQLDELLDDGQKTRSKKSRCTRALIIDGGGNAVQALRAFSKSDYHYITILDTNQIKERKFKHLSSIEAYRYGKASLNDCRIELLDSKDTGYIYESRAVRVHWDNGKECCLVTSIPDTVFDASEVVKAYFDRWPFCEKQYAMMKASVCFYRVVGYGKKQVSDEKMIDRINKHQSDLNRLKEELQIPLSQIVTKEQELQILFEEETRLKENSNIEEGKRIQSRKNEAALEICQRQIRKIYREIKNIEEPYKMKFVTLRKKGKEYARIQNKQEVYHVDVELDQLLTSFRLSFANLLAFLAREILDDGSLEMSTLVQSILFLSGTVEQLSDRRKVTINRNEKDPTFMETLSRGLHKLNALKINNQSGKIYEFQLA